MQDKNNNVDNLKLLSHLQYSDSLLDHSIEQCGKCYFDYILAQTARDMLSSGDTGKDAIKRWDEEVWKRWKNSKYYKLWVEEKMAGRDPHKAFEKRGWIV